MVLGGCFRPLNRYSRHRRPPLFPLHKNKTHTVSAKEEYLSHQTCGPGKPQVANNLLLLQTTTMYRGPRPRNGLANKASRGLGRPILIFLSRYPLPQWLVQLVYDWPHLRTTSRKYIARTDYSSSLPLPNTFTRDCPLAADEEKHRITCTLCP